MVWRACGDEPWARLADAWRARHSFEDPQAFGLRVAFEDSWGSWALRVVDEDPRGSWASWVADVMPKGAPNGGGLNLAAVSFVTWRRRLERDGGARRRGSGRFGWVRACWEKRMKLRV